VRRQFTKIGGIQNKCFTFLHNSCTLLTSLFIVVRLFGGGGDIIILHFRPIWLRETRIRHCLLSLQTLYHAWGDGMARDWVIQRNADKYLCLERDLNPRSHRACGQVDHTVIQIECKNKLKWTHSARSFVFEDCEELLEAVKRGTLLCNCDCVLCRHNNNVDLNTKKNNFCLFMSVLWFAV
jgi:hypothetical protein